MVIYNIVDNVAGMVIYNIVDNVAGMVIYNIVFLKVVLRSCSNIVRLNVQMRIVLLETGIWETFNNQIVLLFTTRIPTFYCPYVMLDCVTLCYSVKYINYLE